MTTPAPPEFTSDATPPKRPSPWRWLPVVTAPVLLLIGFLVAGGWLTPQRLTPQRLVDTLQDNAGIFPGYRRNHAKGVCVAGYFQSNGNAARYSRAPLFAAGRTPLIGRFALPGGNPHAPDGGVPIRSMALLFTQANGQQWRTGMNNMPVFPVATPQAFYEQLLASRPDPATGKPDSAKQQAFFAAHPETSAFLQWIKNKKPSASYASEPYYGLNAFYFVDAAGVRQPVRWQVAPENGPEALAPVDAPKDFLDAELSTRLATAPLRWRLLITLGAPDDPTNDATQSWPAARQTIDAGMVIVEREHAQDSGECRDVNFDPLVLPDGIAPSDDPLLAARSAAYADSYLRRTREQPATAVRYAP